MLTQFQTFTFLSNFQVGLEPNKYLPLERKCFFFTSHLTTHLIWDPHSKLYDDLHSSWSAGFGGCHDDDDDDDFYDDLLRSWSAGSGGCQWCRPFSTLSSSPLGPDPFPGWSLRSFSLRSIMMMMNKMALDVHFLNKKNYFEIVLTDFWIVLFAGS